LKIVGDVGLTTDFGGDVDKRESDWNRDGCLSDSKGEIGLRTIEGGLMNQCFGVEIPSLEP